MYICVSFGLFTSMYVPLLQYIYTRIYRPTWKKSPLRVGLCVYACIHVSFLDSLDIHVCMCLFYNVYIHAYIGFFLKKGPAHRALYIYMGLFRTFYTYIYICVSFTVYIYIYIYRSLLKKSPVHVGLCTA